MAIYGWHFVGDKLRDGRDIPKDGEWLVHEGKIKICESGLHYSAKLIDALRYAPGTTLCRVEVCGVVEERDDKAVAKERKILWRVDVKSVLHKFARKEALAVAHLWDAPEVVIEYLKTGDSALRVHALKAAKSAVHSACYATYYCAYYDAAYDACDAANAAKAAVHATYYAYYAATATKRAEQNSQLTKMVMAEHKKQLKNKEIK